MKNSSNFVIVNHPAHQDPMTKMWSWIMAETGLAMLDEFKLWCVGWVDPDRHQIIKYSYTSEYSGHSTKLKMEFHKSYPDNTALDHPLVYDLSSTFVEYTQIKS
jgi:hypothetical protein